MRALLFLGLVIIAYALQTTFPLFAGPFSSARPDFLLILIIHYALRSGRRAGLWTGVLTGLLIDLSSYQTLGAATFVRGLIGFAAGLARERILDDAPTTRLVMVVIAASVAPLFTSIIVELIAGRAGPIVPHGFFLSLLVTLAMTIPFFSLAGAGQRIVGMLEERWGGGWRDPDTLAGRKPRKGIMG